MIDTIQNTRKAFTEWISSNKNKLFLTITYKEGLPDQLVGSTFNHTIHRVNQKVHGRRYQKHKTFIEGFVVRERQANETLHYHCLLYEDKFKLPSYKEMRSIVINVWPRIIDPERPKKKLMDLKGCDLQEYYNVNGVNKVERYITKTLGNRSYIPQELHDNVAPLGINGALFGIGTIDLRS